ncbi:hypothetical protein [Kocuria marina]|uniref:hypothetical protein n=1 Tax=Kocuria marina TaxID=223184 RepID=UPI00345FD55D
MHNIIIQRQVQIDNADRHVYVDFQYKTDPPGVEKAAVLAYMFLDADDSPIDPIGNFYSSKKFGPFLYLHSGDDAVTEFSGRFKCPENAVRFEVRLYPWAPDVSFEILDEPVIRAERHDPESTFTDAVGSPIAVPVDGLTLRYPVADGAGYNMEWEIDAPPNSQALLTLKYLDSESNELLPGPEFPIHPQYGTYVYAVNRDGTSLSSISFTVPAGASQLTIKGMPWKSNGIRVLNRPTLTSNSANLARLTDSEIRTSLRGIAPTDKVVVIYTTAGALSLTNSLLLRSNRMALEFAKAGWHVIFFPFSELKDDDSEVIDEKILQFGRSRLKLVMDELFTRQGSDNVLLCSSFSDVTMVGLLDRCHNHGWRVIYEVRDDMEEFKRVGFSKWYEPNLETRFAKRADSLLAVSPRLKNKMEAVTGRSDVQLVPNGTPDELIEEARSLRTLEIGLDRSRRNKVGYIGHLTASWFDWPWLLASAQQLPHITFEIIGHGKPVDLVLPSNVQYLGAKSHSECIPYVREWSAGLVPFKITRLTYGVDPNKAYEYVALGIRTVSAPMGQVQDMPGALVYTTQKEMADAIQWAVDNPLSEADLEAYETYLETASWSYRSRIMIDILEGHAR